MTMDTILAELRVQVGVLELAPRPGSMHPEISWGDFFFYYAPDGEVPKNRQPYATVVTKNYPDDSASQLDDAGRWRVNIHVGAALFSELLGYPASDIDMDAVDFAESDALVPHPLYGAYGWIAVVNPGPRTIDRVLDAIREAHRADQQRVERRADRQ